jgi:hypothetical protein
LQVESIILLTGDYKMKWPIAHCLVVIFSISSPTNKSINFFNSETC